MATRTNPDVERITAAVCADYADHLRDTLAHLEGYVRCHVASALTGKRPNAHHRLEPHMAALARELVSEAVYADRRRERLAA